MADPTRDELIVGLRGAKRRWWIAGCVILMAGTVLTVVSAIVDHTSYVVVQTIFAVYVTAYVWLHFRALRADREGIRRRGTVWAMPWSEVETLLEPGRWDDNVAVRTRRSKSLKTGFSAAYLDRLAELSGRPIERHVPAGAKPPTKEQRDLSDRAARIRARNVELLGEYPPTERGTED